MANVFSSEGAFKFRSVATFGLSDETTRLPSTFSGSNSKKKFVKVNCNHRTLKHGHILFFVVKVNFEKISDILSA